ncbi:MAG: hypothetical protein ACP5OR_00025 [Candidatus Dormibacteria bacterium]
MNLDDRIAYKLKSQVEERVQEISLPPFNAFMQVSRSGPEQHAPRSQFRAVLTVLAMTFLVALFAIPGIAVVHPQLVNFRPNVLPNHHGLSQGEASPPNTKGILSVGPYSLPPLQPCGSTNTIIAYLVELKKGISPGTFHPASFAAVPLSPYGSHGLQGLIYVIPRTSHPNWKSVFTENSSVMKAGPIYQLPREKKYRSCYYLLTDRPLDAPFVAAAQASFIRLGYISSQLVNRAIADEIHDDPLLPGGIIVQIDYSGPPLSRPPRVPATVTIHGTLAYLSIETSAHVVLATALIPQNPA